MLIFGHTLPELMSQLLLGLVNGSFYAMLSLGQSRPWPEALETIAGSKTMDATAILDYFGPLSKWLDEQLAGQRIGW